MSRFRADYTHRIEDGILILEDLNLGSISLTNFMEEALTEIAISEELDLTKMKIIYRDSMGDWDGVQWHGQGEYVQFISLNTTDIITAKIRIYAHQHS
jgi:hypothetical protein